MDENKAEGRNDCFEEDGSKENRIGTNDGNDNGYEGDDDDNDVGGEERRRRRLIFRVLSLIYRSTIYRRNSE